MSSNKAYFPYINQPLSRRDKLVEIRAKYQNSIVVQIQPLSTSDKLDFLKWANVQKGYALIHAWLSFSVFLFNHSCAWIGGEHPLLRGQARLPEAH